MRKRWILAVLGAPVAGLIVGCGTGGLSPAAETEVRGAALQGRVMGGLQPVTNATLQLYAVGTAGYGSAGTPLLSRTVMTDATGSFSLTGSYTCPSASTLVYLTATGGNPGLQPGTNNQSLAVISLMGACGGLTPNTFVEINELTTVAAVYALQPFMGSATAIGAPVSNQAGLASAFQTAWSLVNLAGNLPGNAPAIAKIPTVEINSIADVLSSCVNSNGAVAANSACGLLFAAVTPAGGAAPTDTVMALLDMARNPGHNVASIFYLIAATAAYQPALTKAPADWSVAINYTAPAFNKPADLAVDGQGTLWVLSAPGLGGVGATTVSKLTSAGLSASYMEPATDFGNMAIDRFGDVWLTDANRSDVVELTQTGAQAMGSPFSGAGMAGPGPLAFDAAGNAWVVNSSATVSELGPSGAPMSAKAFATGGQSGAVAIAIDAVGQVWTTDSSSNSVSKLTNAGALVAGAPFSNGNLSSPYAIAIDAANEGWVANQAGSTLTKFAAQGNPPAAANVSGGGLLVPIALAIDGNGTAWAVNAGANTISALPAAAGQVGYGSAFLTNPYRLAIDGAGNVWVANVGTPTAGSGVITQIVGAAAPVVTPTALAVRNAQIGQRP